jgi:hypothetical protein
LLAYGARETVRGKGLRPSIKSGLNRVNPSQISGVERKDLPARRAIRDPDTKIAENINKKIAEEIGKKIGEQTESKAAKPRGDAIFE